MGCFCTWRMEDEDDEQRFRDRTLDTIHESLGEKGMPKFTPPVPRNHNELFVQNLVSGKGKTLKPTNNSTVELQFSGWVCEEGDLWRPTSDLVSYQRLRTPLLSAGKDSADPSLFRDSMTRLELLKKRPSKNRSDLDYERVYVSSVSDLGKASSAYLQSSTPASPPSPSVTQLKPSFPNHDSHSISYTTKSTIYGKCFDHTESWEVTLGAGEIVEGLEMVILNMAVGDEVIAFIPSHLAHGEQGLGKVIPPRADLIVQVILQKIM